MLKSRIAIILASVVGLALLGYGIYFVVAPVKDESVSSSSPSPTTSVTPSQATKSGSLEGTSLENFTPIAKVDALQKIDTAVGNGPSVQAGDTVTAHYTGAVAATGKIFQSSLDGGKPIAFSLTQVIKGWTEGVPGMQVGGKRRLLIPAAQAYGTSPPQDSVIPANADLVFDIELTKIGQ